MMCCGPSIGGLLSWQWNLIYFCVSILCVSVVLYFTERHVFYSQTFQKKSPGQVVIIINQGSHKYWKMLGFVNFYEKSWNFTQYLCAVNFLSQVVYNEFLPSYVRYSTRFFLVYLPVSRIDNIAIYFLMIFFVHLIENA